MVYLCNFAGTDRVDRCSDVIDAGLHIRPLLHEDDECDTPAGEVLLVAYTLVNGDQKRVSVLFCSVKQDTVIQGIPSALKGSINGVPS